MLCHVLFVVMLSVIMLSIIMLSIIMLSVVVPLPYFFVACGWAFKLVFVPGRPLQPSLIFASKAGAYPRVEYLEPTCVKQL
jgi:hypothetical protein